MITKPRSRLGSKHELGGHMVFWILIITCTCTLAFLVSGAQGRELAMASDLAVDMQALLGIKSSLQLVTPNISSSLADWVNSDSSSNPCQWRRITCNRVLWLSNQTRVTSLDLSFLGIHGTLPSGFSQLQALSKLNLSHNSITGPLSQSNIGNCTNLTSLDLSFNNLSTIANASSDVTHQGLTNLINLQYLDLSDNYISSNGTYTLALPHKCAQLQHLRISNNSINLDLSQALSWQDCSTSLQYLDLSYNQFTGPIPTSLASLPLLQSLQLRKNKLVGTITTSICSVNSSSLLSLDLSANNLDGTFPLSLLQCLSLQHLDISDNNLTGRIPSQVGQMTSLEVLNLGENGFTGSLPGELGSLANLKVFMAGSNSINGSIPHQITKCQSLTLLGLDRNHLQGTLPVFLAGMVSLEYVALHSNAFLGTIPLAFLNSSSNLKLLDLSSNNLSGHIPTQITNLTSLQYLMLAQNRFTGAIPLEIGHMAGLQILDLSSNYLDEQIPSSLGNLQHLLWLNLAFNNISGPIPPQLGNCTSLLWLNLKSNSLSGHLPAELAFMGKDPSKTFKLNFDKGLYLPKTLGECSVIKRWLPEDYPPYSFVYTILDRDTCQAFWIVLLTKTPFDQVCPESAGRNVPISKGYIQLSDNKLTGPILYNLQANRTISLLLSLNRFTGSLPGGIGQLPLLLLNASYNLLNGSIPESLADNNCLAYLDLSYNNLSGSIPNSLGSLAQLSEFNVSFNPYLEGTIPSSGQFLTFTNESYLNDSLLCLELLDGMKQNITSSAHLPLCNSSSNDGREEGRYERKSKGNSLRSEAVLIVVILSCSAICGAIAMYVVWRKCPSSRRRGKASSGDYSDDDVDDNGDTGRCASKSSVSFFKEISIAGDGSCKSPVATTLNTYTDILLATNNFSDEHVIGSGGFGTVYKAKLRDGSTVAIKKLLKKGSSKEREFRAEMETLGAVTHENLVPLIGFCRCGEERLLVYKLMSNGSLEDWLHGKERVAGEEKISWEVRVRIARECATALGYLHQDCMIIHRDVKASNVLLDEDFKAYVTDFGLARELNPGYSHVSTIVAGTLGYVAPEYWQTWKATTKGDVYSFGVLLLELLTGQQPVSCNRPSLACDGNLVDWVRLLVSQSRSPEAWHPVVHRTAAGRLQQVVEFMRLALACTSDRPEQRPSMQEVALALEDLH